MKIRTDFVTNSSSSSFIACGVYSEDLSEFVIDLLGGKNQTYAQFQVGELVVSDNIVNVTTTLDSGDFYIFNKMEDDDDLRTQKQKDADNSEANTLKNIANAFLPFLPRLTSVQNERLERLIEDAIGKGNTKASVYVDQTDSFSCQYFSFGALKSGAQGHKNVYEIEAEQQWLANYADFITREPLIYFPNSLFVFSGFGFGFGDGEKSNPLVEKVIKRGGIFRAKVSGKTNYLVVDPVYAGAAKIKAVVDLRDKGIFVDVILKEDLKRALKKKHSTEQETEIKEKVLRKREQEAEIRRVKKEQEQAKNAEIRRQEQKEKAKIRRQAQEEERITLKEKREAYVAQTLLSIQKKCITIGKKYASIEEFYDDVRSADIGRAEIKRYIYEKYQQKPEEYLIQNNMLMTKQKKLCAQFDEIIHILATRYAAAQKKAISVTKVWEENPDIDKQFIMNKSVFFTGKTPSILFIEKGIVYSEEELQSKKMSDATPIDTEQIPEKIRKRMDTLFAKLDDAYPDKVIVHLNRDHKEWGKTVTELYRLLGYADYKTFLKAYGYRVNTDPNNGRPKKDPMEIINELKRRYPNGSDFTSIDELKAANPDIASRLKSLSNKSNEYFGMPFTKYLRSIGLVK